MIGQRVNKLGILFEKSLDVGVSGCGYHTDRTHIHPIPLAILSTGTQLCSTFCISRYLFRHLIFSEFYR
jgi:hypothetical protein